MALTSPQLLTTCLMYHIYGNDVYFTTHGLFVSVSSHRPLSSKCPLSSHCQLSKQPAPAGICPSKRFPYKWQILSPVHSRLAKSGMGAARAEDAEGTPTQSHTSPSILVYEDYKTRSFIKSPRDNRAGGCPPAPARDWYKCNNPSLKKNISRLE